MSFRWRFGRPISFVAWLAGRRFAAGADADSAGSLPPATVIGSAAGAMAEAVKAAKGRTSDDLGTKYPKISQPLWTAFQAALSGAKAPQDALKDAQTTAAAATQ